MQGGTIHYAYHSLPRRGASGSYHVHTPDTMKIVIPAYGRHELTRRVALYYDDLGYDAIIVETPDEEGKLSGVEDKVVAQHHNEDGNVLVGRKFNDALRYAANFDDDVVLTGSDSLLSPAYLKHLDAYKEDYLEISGCHFFDPLAQRVTFIDKFLCGSGKYMSRRMMDSEGRRAMGPVGEGAMLAVPVDCSRTVRTSASLIAPLSIRDASSSRSACVLMSCGLSLIEYPAQEHQVIAVVVALAVADDFQFLPGAAP